jgi:hypothetical protein
VCYDLKPLHLTGLFLPHSPKQSRKEQFWCEEEITSGNGKKETADNDYYLQSWKVLQHLQQDSPSMMRAAN